MRKEEMCCFIGHRHVKNEEAIRQKIRAIVTTLVRERRIYTFLFGSRSRFDDLCHEVVTEIRIQYPEIRRVYVRAEFPVITAQYESYLLQRFEKTVYPDCVKGAGRAAYIKRNQYMVDQSAVCVFYCWENTLDRSKSGTRIALTYAEARGGEILRICE